MKNYMFLAILLSIALGIVCGIFIPEQMIAIQWIGQLFINLLKLIVLPLIFCALVSAITSIGGMKRLGSIGVYTLGYVLLSVSIAVAIGLFLLNVFKPGVGIPPSLILANATPTDLKPMAFSSYLLSLFPPNIVAAAAKYEIMPIVFFSIVFSLACLAVGQTATPVISFFVGLRDVLIKMITWLMVLTPVGLFSLLGTAVAEASIEHLLLQSLSGMILFILIFLSGLLLQFLWQLFVVAIVLRKNPKQFISNASNALITAFATSSSMATLPVTLMVAKNEDISDDVARFVLPFATTINLAGTAMYEAVSALFFCQILGLHLSIPAQIGVFITAILAGMGATGIPEGGLVTMVMVLRNVNVPASAIGLLLPFDRILDRFRTMTNVWGDLVCAATVDHLQQWRLKNSNHRAQTR
ncbi:dicarboxylate/amino acid:cation symporter [Aquicella lusitana]|uniref:Na+/H+-dicarboxylate symporter n=1 Tax=Aquicella lusitana TaxID=254246 RepID=A0A370G207_9COXI|nr:dicarboxylate/amino acid:cation symporter [Aquicella lusitana]RDI37270.1 Na+/H+-dicarboxylate symporter [Aquicella lusitana]VVC73649.1 Proton/sodium-glutamate symport protein [Aquicella lusitana]